MAVLKYVQALNQAIAEEMERDPLVFMLGEDIVSGGMGVTPGLADRFGTERIRDTPITEAAFVGAAVGAAAAGMRPICDIMYAPFLYCAFDQLCNQAAKLRYMSGGQLRLPVTYLVAYAGGLSNGGQHSETVYSQLLGVAGLKIAAPSSPIDVKGLVKSAIRDDNPVVVFSHFTLNQSKEDVPDGELLIPLGKAAVKRAGTDVTIVAIGAMVRKALKVAEELAQDGISAEVLDPRTLIPLDEEAILASVAKTSRLVVVDEAHLRGSAASEIAATVAEKGFDLLDAPIKRVASLDTPLPFSPVLERAVIPDEKRIAAAVREICG
ncbi:MAG: alpha-ketoacid dehydrogenase subunit beta [Candidatus Binatia bacterium]